MKIRINIFLIKTALILGLLLSALIASAQCDCDIDVLTADYFEKGKFNELIGCLRYCREKGEFTNDAETKTYQLEALSFIELNQLDSAENSIKAMLRSNPDITIRLTDGSKLYRSLFHKVKLGYGNQIYSVSKTAERKEEAPATVAIITQEQIQQRGYQNIEEMLHDLPGFDISTGRGPSYSNIYQRGYRSNQTDHTLFLIDGVEMNDLSSNNAFISRQYSMTNIKQVEVVYGPISNLYGANAFSGVINVITKDASELPIDSKLGVHSNVSAGSLHTYSADVTALLKTNVLSATISGRVFSSEEMDHSTNPNWVFDTSKPDVYRKLLTTSDSATVAGLVKSNRTELFQLENNGKRAVPTDLAIERAMNSDRALSPAPDYSNATRNLSFYSKFRFANFTVGFQAWKKKEGNIGWYNWRHAGTGLGNFWTVNNTSFYLRYVKNDLLRTKNLDLSFFTRYKTHKVNDKTRFVRMKGYQGQLSLLDLAKDVASKWDSLYFYRISNQLRGEARIRYAPDIGYFDRSEFIIGTEFRDSQIQGDYINSLNVPLNSEVDKSLIGKGNFFHYRDLGFFGESIFKKNNVKFTFGGRIDFNKAGISGGYGSVRNMRTSIVYRPVPFILLKSYYSTAFKDASAFNRYSQASNRAPNLNLRPERINNIEISTIYKPNDTIQIELSAYRAFITQMIGPVITSDGKSQNRSIGDADIKGFHLTAQVKMGIWTCEGNYTYLHPTTSNDTIQGLRIGDMASHRVNLAFNARLSEELNVNVRANFVGSRRTGMGTSVPTNPNSVVDAYQVVNSTVTYRPEYLKGWSFQFVANNILDNMYNHPGVRTAGDGVYASLLPQNGRTLHLKVIYKFIGNE